MLTTKYFAIGRNRPKTLFAVGCSISGNASTASLHPLNNVTRHRAQATSGSLVDLSRQSPLTFVFNPNKAKTMFYLSPDETINISETFSVPFALFRMAYIVCMSDIENATRRSFEIETDIASVLDKILAARTRNHHLYRSTPFASPTPGALAQWRFDYGYSDEVIAEHKWDSFFGALEGEDLIDGIGRRRIWQRIVGEVNQAFAVSVRSINPQANSLCHDDLSDIIDGICLDQNFDQPVFWPDFDEIARRIRSG
jgi:hypothetical protein